MLLYKSSTLFVAAKITEGVNKNKNVLLIIFYKKHMLQAAQSNIFGTTEVVNFFFVVTWWIHQIKFDRKC